MIEECILGNGGVVVSFGPIKIGSGVDRRNRSVVSRLSDQLVVDGNEKIISNIGWIALELGKGLNHKRGQDGD